MENNRPLSQIEIDRKKAHRMMQQRLLKDRAMYVISLLALPAIVIMVGALIFSAMQLQESSLAVVSGLVSSVTICLISILMKLSGADKPDPVVEICKNLIDHLTEDSSKEFIIDDKSIRVVKGSNGTSSRAVGGKADLVWGDDSKPNKKGRKK